MPHKQPIQLRKYLLPFSWLYGFVVFLRNKFFDWGILKEKEYDVPVICVGNITAGGTGKTPHIEYLVHLLQDQYRVAVLSRGYRRKTKGFLLADNTSTSQDIGDEPFQIKQKFPDLILVVDSDRRHGIEQLLALENPPEVILMDDGFQHRYIKPSFVVLLSNYNRPIYKDKLLPVGMLRDSKKKIYKANMVVITKCPPELLPIDYRIMSYDIDLLAYQSLSFTSFQYSKLMPVFADSAQVQELDYMQKKEVLLVTGIASPKVLIDEIERYTTQVEVMSYKDHHTFSKKDIKQINSRFDALASSKKILVVTEKDAARLILLADQLSEEVKANLYYLPIVVKFEKESESINFKENIFKHVKDYTRNSKLYKK